jgi:RNA polymerase sigma-70 factor (ECF subfamily)
VSGDPARRELFERVAADVYQPLQRYLRRRARADDAADALADTLLVVWRRLDEVPDDPLPWCYGVARRCLANQRRSDTRRMRLVHRAAAQHNGDNGRVIDPQHAIESADPALAAAIDLLTDAEAEIVRLWAWEQLEPREIALVLDMTSNAVSVALTRAKRKLAEHLTRQDRTDAGHIRGAGADDRRGEGR